MDIYERIKQLADKDGITIKELEAELGFVKNSLYKWKKASPSIDRVEKVASYFNVSVDFLLGRIDEVELDEFYREALEKIASEKMSALLNILDDYYSVSSVTHDYGEEFTLENRQLNVSHFIDEFDLKSKAGKILSELKDIPTNIRINYEKSVIESELSGKSVAHEMINFLYMEPKNYLDYLSVPADIVNNSPYNIFSKRNFSFMFDFHQISDRDVMKRGLDYHITSSLVFNIKGNERMYRQDIFIFFEIGKDYIGIEFPGGTDSKDSFTENITDEVSPDFFYSELIKSIREVLCQNKEIDKPDGLDFKNAEFKYRNYIYFEA
ncbi:helix-turn-helix domain-containing protein [Listeria aquatica]|uniref:helix-turn-helix domain-containing protein n=1 Tax=Listeria aquatica TaxID=1494960 RepID=UPI003EF7FE88